MKSELKILIVSQYFHPEHFQINKVAKILVQRGCKVTVLTGKPNYPEGRFFKGYRPWAFTEECVDRIHILRTPIVRRGMRNRFLLTINYISFVLSASFFGWLRLRKEKFDLVYCYGTSPILQAIPAIVLARANAAPLVLNVQDLWPQSIQASGNINNSAIINSVGVIVRFIYQKCDLIIGSSRSFVPEIKKLAGNSLVDYLPNFADAESEINHSLDAQYSAKLSEIDKVLDNCFTCVFTGNLGKSQSLETIIAAAHHLSAESHIKIVVFGFGNQFDWLKSQINLLNLTNLHLMGRFPPDMMPFVMSKAGCLLCCLADTKIFRMTVPNKIQSYLAAGRPIVACMAGEGAQIVSDAEAGVVCHPGDGLALANAILELSNSPKKHLRKLGANGRQYFNNNYKDELIVTELMKKFSKKVEKK